MNYGRLCWRKYIVSTYKNKAGEILSTFAGIIRRYRYQILNGIPLYIPCLTATFILKYFQFHPMKSTPAASF